MKLVLHIGMGKTGTSTIQKVLNDHGTELQAQKANYLGMWLDPAILPVNRPTYKDFFIQPPEVWIDRAKTTLETMRRISDETGAETFICSNESFFFHADRFKDFIGELSKDVEVIAVAYARNPRSWLPSAYAQWGIRHKTSPGTIPPFEEMAKQHIKQYEELIKWKSAVGDGVVIRSYDETDDVVQDFLSLFDLEIAIPKEVFYAKVDDAEAVLRLAFNNRYKGQVLPSRFDAIFGRTLKTGVPSLEDIASESFDYSSVEGVISENTELFENFKSNVGIDLLSYPAKQHKIPDVEALRNRLVDYLLQLTVAQTQRLRKLETEIDEIKSRLD